MSIPPMVRSKHNNTYSKILIYVFGEDCKIWKYESLFTDNTLSFA